MEWTVICLVYCGVLFWLSLQKWEVLQLPWINYVAIVGFLLLTRQVLGAAAATFDYPYSLAVAAISVLTFAILLLPYVMFLIVEYSDRARKTLTGVGQMKIRKTYDVAEKLEHARKFGQALALYRVEADHDPKDAEARRRAGEICLKMGRAEEAVRWFEEAVGIMESEEDRVTLSFRRAEILEQQLRRPDEARAVLESVVAEHPGTKFAWFARERIEKLS